MLSEMLAFGRGGSSASWDLPPHLQSFSQPHDLLRVHSLAQFLIELLAPKTTKLYIHCVILRA